MSKRRWRIEALAFVLLVFWPLEMGTSAQVEPGKEVIDPYVKSEKADWRKYGLNLRGLAVSFPKFPTTFKSANPCESYEKSTFAAYSEEVVYTAIVVSKRLPDSNQGCHTTIPFGNSTLERRISELNFIAGVGQASKQQDTSDSRILLIGATNRILIVPDLENGRFVELWASYNKGRSNHHSEFFDSLDLDFKGDAVPVKSGALRTIGDKEQSAFSDLFSKEVNASETSFPLKLIHNPRAVYTDAARTNKTQGTVILTVVFHANGGIGEIAVVRGLPSGLTEMAHVAATRISFIPKKENGVNRTVRRVVEYTFTIY